MISQGPSLCIFNKSDPQEVLASWLFAQYLLTNDVQIAYSGTEGYVPVTLKAQTSPEYQAYLNDESGDAAHYPVKLEAAKLLLSHLDDTFVTPVYNGSASLRDAAGQLIENVVKSVRRRETVDEEYIQQLYDNVTSLYRLDQTSSFASGSGKRELGPLPEVSVALLAALGVIWAAILAYTAIQSIKKRKSWRKNV